MQQRTSKLLYEYWNTVRDERFAPQRYEIEPAKIAALLPETFIVECGGLLSCRFRLAGTRVCEHFGRELRGVDMLDLWNASDRHALERLLQTIVAEGAVGTVLFEGFSEDGRKARFEMVLLPLVHTGKSVNRLMGAITAIDAPFWLGARSLTQLALDTVDVVLPGRERQDGALDAPSAAPPDVPSSIVRDGERRFRVFDGGRLETKD